MSQLLVWGALKGTGGVALVLELDLMRMREVNIRPKMQCHGEQNQNINIIFINRIKLNSNKGFRQTLEIHIT